MGAAKEIGDGLGVSVARWIVDSSALYHILNLFLLIYCSGGLEMCRYGTWAQMLPVLRWAWLSLLRMTPG